MDDFEKLLTLCQRKGYELQVVRLPNEYGSKEKHEKFTGHVMRVMNDDDHLLSATKVSPLESFNVKSLDLFKQLNQNGHV